LIITGANTFHAPAPSRENAGQGSDGSPGLAPAGGAMAPVSSTIPAAAAYREMWGMAHLVGNRGFTRVNTAGTGLAQLRERCWPIGGEAPTFAAMFTGIVTDIGTIARMERGNGGATLTIATEFDTEAIPLGASIGCGGVCLTVVAKAPGTFTAEASIETMACSTLGDWRKGARINLEQALKLGDEMGGHLVLGHVDGIATVVERRPDGDSVRFAIEAPAELAPFIASKGSVALDGVSLTVNEVAGRRFGVNIIPHTLARTTIGEAQPGTRLNLEIDPIARYVARLLDVRGGL
jgi:riboflavin synthase